MKRLLKILGVLLLLAILFLVYDLSTIGTFRSIENSYQGSIERYDIPGAEDFAMSREDGFMIISSDDRAGRRDGKDVVSGLYYMDLHTKEITPLITSREMAIYPHGIHMLRLDSTQHRLLVVNHITESTEGVSSLDIHAVHSIEEFILEGKSLRHVKSHKDDLVFSPNDVVGVDETRFYYTNDHGSKTSLGLQLEDLLGFKRSNVGYFDGSKYRIVAEDIAYANGINIDHSKDILFVASPRHVKVIPYNIKEDGSLDKIEEIPCKSGVDNIEMGPDGKLWIGSHPKALLTLPYFAGTRAYSPSEIITIDYRGKGDYDVKSIYESDGVDMSASTVALPYKDKIYIGCVMDDHFIALDAGGMRNME